MKIWIDKHGGMHYHKADCRIIKSKTPPILPYEEIQYRLRGNSLFGYRDIIVDGKRYSSCPFCFGHKGRKE